MWNRLMHDHRVVWAIRSIWVLYATAQFVSTHLPNPDEVVVLPEDSDKPIHAAAFFLLTLLTAASFPGWLVKRKSALKLIAYLALYGVFDEITQWPMGRTTDPIDWACDLTGIVLGTALAWTAVRWWNAHACIPTRTPEGARSDAARTLGSRVQV